MKEKQKHLTMKELPVTERPYEKCEKNARKYRLRIEKRLPKGTMSAKQRQIPYE